MSVFVLWILFPLWISNAENIAHGKNEKQSSVYNNWDASYAVNGSQCSVTNLESQPWWAVDLGAIYNVTNIDVQVGTYVDDHVDIDVLMPIGCLGDKWATFQRAETSHCQVFDTNFILNYYVNFSCLSTTVGRFVRIKARLTNQLSVCQVKLSGVLDPNQAMSTKGNVHKALGYNGMGYNGSVLETTHASSNLHCTSICRITQRCCVAEFIKSNNQCIMFSKTDDNEESFIHCIQIARETYSCYDSLAFREITNL